MGPDKCRILPSTSGSPEREDSRPGVGGLGERNDSQGDRQSGEAPNGRSHLEGGKSWFWLWVLQL